MGVLQHSFSIVRVNIWWFLDLTLHRFIGVNTAVYLVDVKEKWLKVQLMISRTVSKCKLQLQLLRSLTVLKAQCNNYNQK